MNPFARMSLSSVLSSVALAKGDALRRGILVSSLRTVRGRESEMRTAFEKVKN